MRILTAIFVLFALAASAPAQTPPPAPRVSIVYADHNPDAITEFHPNARVVHAMVDRLVMAVTGEADVARAWGSLVKPEDKVGIKISAAGGELFTTHHEVVDAIVDGLAASGYPRGKIIVWDRWLTDIKEAGYKPNSVGYQLRSISPRDGYDAKSVFSAPLLGKLIWGDSEYRSDLGKRVPLADEENTSTTSHFSRIIVNDVNKIINVPVMSNTEMNGIAGCLYNVTIPNIDNWRRFSQPTGFGASSIAEIYSDPRIGPKVVLNMVDGLVAQYAGGPEPMPQFSEHHATIYASKDPVALDSVILKKLEQWRARASLPAIGQMAAYVQAASMIGLGNESPDRVRMQNVGRESER